MMRRLLSDAPSHSGRQAETQRRNGDCYADIDPVPKLEEGRVIRKYMSCRDLCTPSALPNDEKDEVCIKTLAEVTALFETPPVKATKVAHEPLTAAKGTQTLLTEILLTAGGDTASQFAKGICELLSSCLETIAHSPTPTRLIDTMLNLLSSTARGCPLSIHRTTLPTLMPQLTRAQMDQHLGDQYVSCLHQLDQEGRRASHVILAMDDTHEYAKPCHLNGDYPYIYVGQKNTMQRGLNYPAIYDVTHQFFVGCHQEGIHLTPPIVHGVDAWLWWLREKVSLVRSVGSEVTEIELDRGFFRETLFAAATTGLLTPGLPLTASPRVIVPCKFGANKTTLVWKTLLDPTRETVCREEFVVTSPVAPVLRTSCVHMFPPDQTGAFHVPYACVALVDEYGSTAAGSFPALQTEAQALQPQITAMETDLEATEETYFRYLACFIGTKATKPSYGRGAKRKNFHDSLDRALYEECFRLTAAIAAFYIQKQFLLKRVIFFAISLRPDENPTLTPELFLAFAHDYRQRWGIENGFRDTKQVFLLENRSDCPSQRQFWMMVGMMLYNRWHVDRSEDILAQSREDCPDQSPFVADRPWVREKLERRFRGKVPARAYLIRLWVVGAKNLFQKAFQSMV